MIGEGVLGEGERLKKFDQILLTFRPVCVTLTSEVSVRVLRYAWY